MNPIARFLEFRTVSRVAWLCLLLLVSVSAGVYSAHGQTALISRQPVDATIFYGDAATFNVIASGPSLSYQWYRNGSAVPAASASSYTLPLVFSNDSGAGFSVRVTNNAGAVTSSIAMLTVDFGTLGAAQTNTLVQMTNRWRYNVNGTDLGLGWPAAGYDDSAWGSGPALLYTASDSRTSNITGGPLLTPLGLTPGSLPTTCYFRSHFTNSAPASSSINLMVTTVLDDAAVVYLNGSEAFRLGITNDPIYYTNYAGRTVGDAAAEGPAVFISTNLVPGDNVLAAEVHQANATSSDVVWGMSLDAIIAPRIRDATAPTLVQIIPTPGTTVPVLTQFEVHFSEGVKAVQANSLLVNGVPATNVTAYAASVYVFDFPQPPAGTVQLSWSPGQLITDLSANSNRFAGGTYSYTLDPTLTYRSVRINEFMASNKHTIRDEDGQYLDWIELYNGSDQTVNLAGWYLTDDTATPAKWQVPNGVSMLTHSYLLIWASGLDRTNPAAPLHTNFKLGNAAGNSLELVFSDGRTVMSAFAPYPQQYDDVSYGSDRLTPSLVGYFTNATPGAANATLGPGFAPEVQFSVPGGTFQSTFTLRLSTTDPNAVIRYLLVTNSTSAVITVVPDNNSPIYSSPITISGSVQVRARAFSTLPGYFPGPLHNETYLQVAASAASFSSDLPIVVFHDMGAGDVAATEDQFMTMEVFDNKYGRASLLNPPDLVVQGYFHRRGQATFWNPKANLRVETQNAYGDNLNVELLGLPADNDWVFYGIDVYDKVLMHNPLSHELYTEMGHYTSRTRYCEVFLKDDAGTPGPITSSDYNGLYVLEEKIKIGKNRVDIDQLQPENTTAPSVTGGYLLSIDKSNPGWSDYIAGVQIWYLDPDFAVTYVPEQLQYIEDYFNNFYAALTGPNWTNPATGYLPFIDLSSWIDYHLHQTFVFNVDALRISTYFSKPRSAPLVQGPLWDFDRCFGTCTSDDQRGFNPRRWRSGSMDGGTDMFNPSGTFNNPWYGVMFTNPDFWQQWIDRYQELRRSVYSLTNLMARIDYFGTTVREATTREYPRWRGQGSSDTSPRFGSVSGDGMTYIFPSPPTWQGEWDFVKYWFSNRVAFMDGNFLNPPTFSTNGGPVAPGYVLTINAPTVEANSTIYYTLDGTDPRLPGGAVNPAAHSSINTAAVTLNSNARVFARNWNASHRNLTGPNNPPISSSWSGPTVATFVTATPPLRITEIMFNPPAPPAGNTNNNDNFEFIEFQNTSGAAINLQGYTLGGGVNFTFGNYQLGAGQFVVVVRNLAAFQSRYPGVSNIAGVYTNGLNNAGDHQVLNGPLQEPILDFSFNDSWCPAADGLGFSMVIRDSSAPVTSWNSAGAWRASSAFAGSPGAADPPSQIPPVLITEALTHTDLPQLDTIELFNPTTNWVDISGWFLTDDRHTPAKYRIPNGSFMPPGGYSLFNSNQFGVGPGAFELSSIGDQVYVFSGEGTSNLTGYAHGFSFGPAPNGVSFGRYVNSQNAEQFVLQSANTLGTNNAYPRVGPLVVSEILYHPPDIYPGRSDDVDEYIELWNIAATNVSLYDPNARSNSWHLRNAISYDFPTNASLAAGGRLVVVSFDPAKYPATLANFQTKYGLPASVPVFGPWTGKLNNGGETIELLCPDNPNITPTNVFVPYYLVEKISYNNVWPWPISADGGGMSLQRIQKSSFGNDPVNWQAVQPFAGQPTMPSIVTQPTNVTVYGGASATFTVGANGSLPLHYQWYFNATNVLAAATNASLTLTNVQMSQAGNYRVVITNSLGTATSQNALLTVVAAPMITGQPTDQFVPVGGVADFEVQAEGSALTYQWFYNTNISMPGSAANLILFNTQPSQAGTYHVLISNPYGSVTSRLAQLTVMNPPSIATQPTNLTVVAGSNALFSVAAGGTPPFTYQWYWNGTTPVGGGTSAALNLSGVQWTDAGSYQAVVANAVGTATSAVAVLRVLVPPGITLTSLNVTRTNVSVSLNSVPGLNYQLQYKNTLKDAVWTSVSPVAAGTGGIIILSDTNGPPFVSRFYRVNCY